MRLSEQSAPIVFLAAPFTGLIESSDGLVGERWRTFLSTLYDELEERYGSVFSAHRREEWGKALMAPDTYAPLDLEAMRDTQMVCAIVGKPASGGVLVELGWATAFRKPILLVRTRGAEYTPLLKGLKSLSIVHEVWIDALDEGDVVGVVMGMEQVADAMATVAGST